MWTFVFLPVIFMLHAQADSFSRGQPVLKPIKIQPPPAPANTFSQPLHLKDINLVAPNSTYRSKPDPIIAPMKKFETINIKPGPTSDLKNIKMEKWGTSPGPLISKPVVVKPVGINEELSGYIYYKNSGWYLSENPGTTYPTYRVEFADFEDTIKVCRYDRDKNCPKYRARFKKVKGRTQIVGIEEVAK